MRIAVISPLSVSVPPSTYGGGQRIVHLLTEELVRRGHDVTLYASGDSRTSAKLHAAVPTGLYDAMRTGSAADATLYVLTALAAAASYHPPFDIIHSFHGTNSVAFHALSAAPVLSSIGIPISADDLWTLERYPQAPVTVCSKQMLAPVPRPRRRTMRIVHHACDFAAWRVSPAPGRYLAFLGRMNRQKSPCDAIRVARKAGMPIVLAGEPRNPYEDDYFNIEVKPRIDGRNVIWLGEVNDRQKNDLLKDAAALIFPIRDAEAFGIVMIEAMACGVPVIGRKLASVPEVVDYGKTGYYADSIDAMAALVPRAMALDRRAVRKHAAARFGHRKMADDYLRLYKELVNRPCA